MTLNQWTHKNLRLPLLLILVFTFLSHIAYLTHWSLSESSLRDSALHRLSQNISLGINQKNRPLIESVFEIAYNDLHANQMQLCLGQTPIISFANRGNLCVGDSRSLLQKSVTIPIEGMPDYKVLATFPTIPPLSKTFPLIISSVLILIGLFLILFFAQTKLRLEVLEPLRAGLNNNEPLKIAEINELRTHILKLTQLKTQTATAEALFLESKQIAHDIRNPLMVLDVLAKRSNSLPPDEKEMLFTAVKRIRDIASNLLTRKYSVHTTPFQQITLAELREDISSIVKEKTMQQGTVQKIKFSLECNPEDRTNHKKVMANKSDFYRVISNLLNNAIEAIHDSGRVDVSLGVTNDILSLTIKDNGQGIPDFILPKLMNQGATFGKDNGVGLGLFHAKKIISGWNGSIGIQSQIGIGTSVEVMIPLISKT